MVLRVLMDLIWIFGAFFLIMDYEKSLLWSWGVGSVSYASKWDYGSFLGAYVKWNVEYLMSLAIELSWVF